MSHTIHTQRCFRKFITLAIALAVITFLWSNMPSTTAQPYGHHLPKRSDAPVESRKCSQNPSNHVTNCGFETYDGYTDAVKAEVEANGFINLSSDPAEYMKIKYWYISANNLDWILHGVKLTCSEGQFCLDLTGQNTQGEPSGKGSIHYNVSTLSKRSYKVIFDLAGNIECGPVEKHLRVSTDAGESQEFTFDTTGKTRTDLGWVKKEWKFKSRDFSNIGGHTQLKFSSLDEGTCGPLIDNVEVVEIAPR